MKYIVLSLAALALLIGAFVLGLKIAKPQVSQISQLEDASPQQISFFFQGYKNHLQNQLNNAQCPGAAILVVHDSSILFAHGFGVKSLGGTDSINLSTVFRIGSLSKAFAGILTGQLVESGILSWDSKVSHFLPYFSLRTPEQSQLVEVQHLLSHSIGFPRHAYTYKLEDLKSPREIAEDFQYLFLKGNPGEYYAYQNVAFAMIEEVIETASGTPYEDLLRQQIFTPAGMLDASTNYEGIQEYYNRALPHSYNRKENRYEVDSISHKYYNAISAGGINASLADMASWIQVLLGNRPEVVSKEVLSEVFHPYINTTEKDLFFNKWQGVSSSHYAMGWRFLSYKDKPLIYHGGYVNEYRGELALDPERKLAICALFNSNCTYANIIVPDFFEWVEMYEKMLKGS